MQTIAKNFLNKVEKKDVLIPEGAEVRIIQNTDDIRYMILPASPKSLTQSDLKLVAGGGDVQVSTEVELVAVEAQCTATTTTAAAETEVAAVVVLVLV